MACFAWGKGKTSALLLEASCFSAQCTKCQPAPAGPGFSKDWQKTDQADTKFSHEAMRDHQCVLRLIGSLEGLLFRLAEGF